MGPLAAICPDAMIRGAISNKSILMFGEFWLSLLGALCHVDIVVPFQCVATIATGSFSRSLKQSRSNRLRSHAIEWLKCFKRIHQQYAIVWSVRASVWNRPSNQNWIKSSCNCAYTSKCTAQSIELAQYAARDWNSIHNVFFCWMWEMGTGKESRWRESAV